MNSPPVFIRQIRNKKGQFAFQTTYMPGYVPEYFTDKVYTRMNGVPFDFIYDEDDVKPTTTATNELSDRVRKLTLEYGGGYVNEIEQTPNPTHCMKHLCRLKCGYCRDEYKQQLISEGKCTTCEEVLCECPPVVPRCDNEDKYDVLGNCRLIK